MTAEDDRPERIARRPSVYTLTAQNAGPKTLEGTRTYVVGTSHAYVIDPGPLLPEHLERVTRFLRITGRSAAGILLTHGHPDHAAGASLLSSMLGVPVWAAETLPYPQYHAPAHHSLYGDTVLVVDGDVLRVVLTPGHTPDSVCFWSPRERVLFAGDTILGRGTSLVAPPEGDMAAYMDSLDTLQRLRPRIIAPGHGPIVTDGASTIAEYIGHRKMREAGILASLNDGPATVRQLVARLYSDVDQHLWPLAEGSIVSHLDKLQTEGRVESDGTKWHLKAGD